MFRVPIAVTSQCVTCRRPRPVDDAKRILGHELTVVVKTPEPCQCGDDRVRVSVRLPD